MADNQPALLIKLSATDTGARPLPAGTVFWSNTSIRLLHPSDTTIDDATSKEGVPTTIEVTASNISSRTVTDVRVEAYVCNPTASGASPSNTVTGISADGRFVGFLPGTLASGVSRAINCVVAGTGAAWTPTAAQAGHHCVIANTFLDDGSEGAALGPVELLQPLANPHHGWRNMNVVALPHDEPAMRFAFVVANPDREVPVELRLKVEELRGEAALGLAERELLRSGPLQKIKPILSPLATRRLVFEDGGKNGGNGENGENGQHGEHGGHGHGGHGESHPSAEASVKLEPGQVVDRSLKAQFDHRETVGNLHTFDITTVDPKGVIQGGFRLLAIFAT